MISHEPEGTLQANCKDTKKKMFDQMHEKQKEIQYVALNSSLSPIPKAMYVLGNFISVITKASLTTSLVPISEELKLGVMPCLQNT